MAAQDPGLGGVLGFMPVYHECQKGIGAATYHRKTAESDIASGAIIA